MQEIQCDSPPEDSEDQAKTPSIKVISRTTIIHLGKSTCNSVAGSETSKDEEVTFIELPEAVSFGSGEEKDQTPVKAVVLEEEGKTKIIVERKHTSIERSTMTDGQSSCRDEGDKVEKEEQINRWLDESKEYEIEDFDECDDNYFLAKCIDDVCATSAYFVGSMCGITLITMILWKMLDSNIISLHEIPEQDSFLVDYLKKIVAVIFQYVYDLFSVIRLNVNSEDFFVKQQENSFLELLVLKFT